MQASLEQTPADIAKAAIDRLGLTIESVFVPFSQSRNAKEKQFSLNWKVTLKRDGREVLTTDYMAGSGHCPSYNKKPPAAWDRPARFWQPSVTAWECEHGFAAVFSSYAGFSRSNIPTQQKKHLEPDAVSVIHSLVMDSDVLDSSSFEEWASNLGYDPDSRSAEKIYRACLEIALKLRNGIGEAGLAALREAFQDY